MAFVAQLLQHVIHHLGVAMSLELAVKALATSIDELILTLKGPEDSLACRSLPTKPSPPRDDAASTAKGAIKKLERSKPTPSTKSVELDQSPPPKSSGYAETSQSQVPGQASEPDAQGSYNRAAAAITALAREKGREVALQVLESFGASRLPNVAPELLESVTQAAEEALAGVVA